MSRWGSSAWPLARVALCLAATITSVATAAPTAEVRRRFDAAAWHRSAPATPATPTTPAPDALPAEAPPTPSPLTLATLSTPADAVLRFVGPTATCGSGFTADASLVAAAARPLVGAGGVSYTEADLARWRRRALSGPFVVDGDFKPGSPGDWSRIRAAAEQFRRQGEATLDPAQRPSHGMRARDAAFVARVNDDAALARGVRGHLLAMVAAPSNDFATLCYRTPDGKAPGGDAWFGQAVWTYRLAITYDLVRPVLDEPARRAIENWLRRQAYFFAGQIDRDLVNLFPGRLDGDYGPRAAAAAATAAEPYLSLRLDTNGDGVVDARDAREAQPIHAYVDAAGRLGPRLSVVSQFFNNRRADLANAFGTIGLMLADEVLIARAQRYHMEWLTWSVHADGSEGELARSGEYCTPKAGLIYAQANLQAALHFAHRLRVVRGDERLLRFSTTDGIWGSETPAQGRPKSLAMVVETRLKLATGELQWYLPEPWLGSQVPRPATLLAAAESRFMCRGPVLESFHEAGLLLAADSLPELPIRAVLLRDPAVTALPFPGLGGQQVNTGFGAWSDVKGVIPGLYFWAVPMPS